MDGYGYVYLLNGEGVDKFDSDGNQVDFERAYFDVGLAVDGHGNVYGVNHSWLDSASYAEGNVSVFEILKFSPEGVLLNLQPLGQAVLSASWIDNKIDWYENDRK